MNAVEFVKNTVGERQLKLLRIDHHKIQLDIDQVTVNILQL